MHTSRPPGGPTISTLHTNKQIKEILGPHLMDTVTKSCLKEIGSLARSLLSNMHTHTTTNQELVKGNNKIKSCQW